MSTFFEQLARLSPERRALLERKLAEQGLQQALPDTLRRRAEGARIPLSFAQQRLWFVQQLEPANTAYNVSSVLRLSGRLDVTAMQRALCDLVGRHEILRTRFVSEAGSQPEQIVEPATADPAAVLPLIDLSDTASPDAAARERIARLTGTPFDLARVPLRTELLKLAGAEHLLVLGTHHIVSDRWSVGVFLRELATLYHAHAQGQPSPLAPLPAQYADWAIWQREALDGGESERLSAFWLARLGGDLPLLDLPHDRPRPRVASDRGAQLPLQLPAALSDALRALAQQKQVTLFALLLTAFKVLLARYSDSEDIVVGTDIANRERPETESMIGLLVNTLVLRSDLAGNPQFDSLLAQVRQTVLDAMAHQAMPFEKLVELLNPERHLDQLMPLFQAKFDLQLATVRPMELAGLTMRRETPADERTKYELRFNLQDTPDGISGQIEYSRDLFDEATMARMAAHFEALLAGIVAQPDAPLDALPLMDAAARRAALFAHNDTARDYPSVASLAALFEQQAARTPDAVAVSDTQQSLTYRELDARADALAQRLIDAGIGAEAPVGVCMPRSARLITGLLAVLKAGGCYIPLDPEYPAERLRFIAGDAGMRVLLTDALADGALPLDGDLLTQIAIDDTPAAAHTARPARSDAAARLAYVIYTSGSTGRPKGVAIEHRNAVAMVHWAQDAFAADELTCVLAATSICFDLSVFEIFVPLSVGGRVHVVDNALALATLSPDCGVTLVNTVPSVLTQLLNSAGLPASVRVVNLAGEALPPALIERLRTLGHVRRACNLYGPSEDTTYSTWASFDLDRPLPPMARVAIGHPITNTQAYVLDAAGQPLPPGIPGELHLGGAGLARGYLGRPELTSTSFITNPFAAEGAPSARLYRTGDRVRRRGDGALEFLGRRDDQVKIRGYRIETGETDNALRMHPAVRDVVVTAQAAASGDLQLVACVEIAAGTDPAALRTELRDFLLRRLPAWLVPAHLHVLDALPRLPNGKVDRRALPALNATTHDTPFEAPRNDTERALADVWAQVLGREQVGIHDNFFELGGHSLLAIEIVARGEQALGRALPLRALFHAPTVARLAAWLAEADPAAGAGMQAPRLPLQPDPASRHEPFPLTDIQQAYLLGRNAAFELGNIGTHGYREIEASGLDAAAVEHALQTLVARHDMLRAVVTPDGRQRILADVPPCRIAVHALGDLTPAARENALLAVRERLSHQVFDLARWPLFQIEASELGNGRTRFHLSFDVVIGDAWSFQLLGREVAQLLQGATLPPLTASFRDYVLAERVFEDGPAYTASLDYWRTRLPELPPSPELPLAMAPSQLAAPRFVRRGGRLPAADWKRLQARAHAHGLTPSGIVLAVFAESLARYSRHGAFTLNLTLFNRLPLHPDVSRLIGDFTASMLLGLDQRGDRSLVDNAQRLQARLWEGLEHRAVSGVRVQRELARAQGRNGGALMPVVFTSTLNQSARPSGARDWQTDIVFSVSQTSQVYLDHQVSEVEGALQYNWDAIDALFPPGLLDALCAGHAARLRELAAEDDTAGSAATAWLRPAGEATTPGWLASYNSTWQTLHEGDSPLLHTLFLDAAQRHGDRPAVIAHDRTLDYAALSVDVRRLAARLVALGVQPNELVAVSIPKGWQQVVATLGALAAGAAYVPIDPALPATRRHELLADTAARVLLSCDDCRLDWPASVQQLRIRADDDGAPLALDALPRPRATDLAYVIYTSGSTGMPKGVMIDHRGAVNTVLDINRRHAVSADDRVFGLSSLSFDLSVYDLFGTLAAGAALVLPDATRMQQPAHWRELLRRHRVTVWNSVPALMQLLLDTTTGGDGDALRLVMLSGDWIPLTLPDAIRTQFPQAAVIGMGGATEASIWSIDFPVGEVDPAWHSIPYGRPLASQQWYVLDALMNPCPPWVPGQLYIGGSGVARGYWRQPELTARKFVPNPFGAHEAGLPGDAADTPRRSASVLYHTGDLGLYRPDGTLEFLGREDHQIKINGYRVELGEIESVLQQHPALAGAAVAAHGTPATLTAYVVPALADGDGNAHHPLAKLDFKQQRRGWRDIDAASSVALPTAADTGAAALRRQSHRRFTAGTIPLARFAGWLSALQAHPLDGAPLPKYRYPSAGNLYPLQAYVEVQPGRIEGLDGGWYYYHPGEHRLARIDAAPSAGTMYGPNQAVFEGSAFGLFLVARRSAIEPVYGEQARDLALVEAGYAGQLLMETAPDADLGLCPVGGRGLLDLTALLGLDDDFVPLHGLLGGGIEAAWSAHWQAMGGQDAASTHAVPAGQSIGDTLLAWLRTRLPAYMVPSRVQLLAALPLTPNGKLDRKALPAPDAVQARYVAPSTPTETRIAALWQSLLSVERAGMQDDFFALGGNSLIAMQLMARLRDEFAVELNLGQLFGALTPGAQALLIDGLVAAGAHPVEAAIPRATRDEMPIAGIDVDAMSDDSVEALLQKLMAEGADERA